MGKIILDDTITKIDPLVLNENFRRIAAEFQDKVLYRDNPVGEPNQLETDVDANGQTVYNLRVPTSPNEAASKQYVDEYKQTAITEIIEEISGYTVEAKNSADAAEASSVESRQSADAALDSKNQANTFKEEARISAESAEVSANLSEGSAIAAAAYSSLGLGMPGVGFDLGFITDTFIIFPTDFGAI